jgi:hypothetical protein
MPNCRTWTYGARNAMLASTTAQRALPLHDEARLNGRAFVLHDSFVPL